MGVKDLTNLSLDFCILHWKVNNTVTRDKVKFAVIMSLTSD